MIARPLRTLACVVTVAAALALDLAAQTRTPAPAPPPAPVAIPSTIDENARETRDRLRELLDQYPPSLAQVLRLDPSLVSRADYVAPYPRLAAFLAQHPEVAHNPVFFLGDARFNVPDMRNHAMNMLESVLAGIACLAGVGLFIAKSIVIEEVAQVLHVISVLAMAVGVGFVVSALVAYALSQRLGLLDSPRTTHA